MVARLSSKEWAVMKFGEGPLFQRIAMLFQQQVTQEVNLFGFSESKRIHCAYGQIVTEVIGATVLE